MRFALAGPTVTLVVVAVFAAIALALPASAPAALKAVVDYELYVNAIILAFNLLPAFPLDCGRVTRALLWARGADITLGGVFGGLWQTAAELNEAR